MRNSPQTHIELGLMQGFPPPGEKIITVENFLQAPYNRWAFQHMRRIVPTISLGGVSAATAPGFNLREDLAQLQVTNTAGEDVPLDDFLEDSFSDAFVVFHNQEIVYQRFWNGMNETTPHQLNSVTKSFVGTLIMQQVMEGRIDPGKSIADYIPDLQGSAFEDATIQQCLDMQVGVEWSEEPEVLADPDCTFNRYFAAAGIAGKVGEPSSTYVVLPQIAKDGEHGGAFHYVSPVADALGWLLEVITGKPFARLLQGRLLAPLGLLDEAHILCDGWGKALTTGGLNLSARDLGRFGLMVQNNGQWQGQQIIDPAILHDIRFNGDKAAFAVYPEESDWIKGGHYRNQWWMDSADRPGMMAVGVYGQFLYVNPEANTTIVRLASAPDSIPLDDGPVATLFRKVSEYLNN